MNDENIKLILWKWSSIWIKNIKQHCMQLKLNTNTLNQIQLSFNWIDLKKINTIQIGTQSIENMLIIYIICDYGG
jgi:hypothetical protein